MTLKPHCISIMLNTFTEARMYARKLRQCAVMVAVLPHVSFAHAQDAGRLEKEVQSLKLRLSKIEAALGNAEQKPVIKGTEWKSLAAWWQLKTNMNPNQVRTIFMDDGLYEWIEPK